MKERGRKKMFFVWKTKQHSEHYMAEMKPLKFYHRGSSWQTHLADKDGHVLLFIGSVTQGQSQLLLAVNATQLHLLGNTGTKHVIRRCACNCFEFKGFMQNSRTALHLKGVFAPLTCLFFRACEGCRIGHVLAGDC